MNAQEYGLPDHELGEDRVARYASAVLQRLWWLGGGGCVMVVLHRLPRRVANELTWYEGLPGTLEQAYGQWREKRSALTEVTEEV